MLLNTLATALAPIILMEGEVVGSDPITQVAGLIDKIDLTQVVPMFTACIGAVLPVTVTMIIVHKGYGWLRGALIGM